MAANVAERLHTRRGSVPSAEPTSGRLLEDGHFDFRGGRRPSRQGPRTRLGDVPPAG